jgi:hypothetical protein
MQLLLVKYRGGGGKRLGVFVKNEKNNFLSFNLPNLFFAGRREDFFAGGGYNFLPAI